MLMTIYKCIFFYICLLSLVFLSLNLYVYGMLLQIKTCIEGSFKICCECMWLMVSKVKIQTPDMLTPFSCLYYNENILESLLDRAVNFMES